MNLTRRIQSKSALVVCCAILCATSVAFQARAQDAPPPLRALTDADYPHILNALRVAGRAAAENFHKNPGEALAEQSATLRSVESGIETLQGFSSGKIDVLTWLRARSPRVHIAPGARYDAKCSAQAMNVILTFGIPAADHHAAVTDIAAGKTSVRTGEEAMAFVRKLERSATTSPATVAADKAIRAALRFYQSKGFTYEGSIKHVHTLAWPDNAKDSLFISVYEFNDLPMGAFGVYPICTHMATGPYVSMGFAKGAGQTRRDSLGQAAEERHDQVFERAGLDKQQIDSIVRLADMARLDVDNEDALRMLLEIPDETVKRETAIRIRNVDWYRRHAAVLGPLFEKAGYPVFKQESSPAQTRNNADFRSSNDALDHGY